MFGVVELYNKYSLLQVKFPLKLDKRQKINRVHVHA